MVTRLKTDPYANFITRPSRLITPQSQVIPGRESDMERNDAGAYGFILDPWQKLDRFLILGSEGGTYYVGEQELTAKNAQNVIELIKKDGPRVVRRTVEVSDAGRATKNDPALFVLALAISQGDNATKRAVISDLSKVARIPTHLFQFVSYATNMRGWGRALREAVAQWYTTKDAKDVAYQTTKYQSRDGWSNRDLLRLTHAKTSDADLNKVFHWIVKGWEGVGPDVHPDYALRQIWAFETAKKATTSKEIVTLIRDFNLPRECVPTVFLKDRDVWEALLVKMPMTAMIRNLATMTRNGVIAELSDGADFVSTTLVNETALAKARVHPITLYSALKTYQTGHGVRSHGEAFKPVAQIVNALEKAFYLSFKHVESSGKRLLLGVDISGSMHGGQVAGIPGLDPAEAAALMAMVTVRTEPRHALVAFHTSAVPMRLNAQMSLTEVQRYISSLGSGGTDCSVPIKYARNNGLEVDTFVIYTDSQTWCGYGHPSQVLREYRDASKVPAKLVSVAAIATHASINDPKDASMLEVVGMDTQTPQIISAFSRGDF